MSLSVPSKRYDSINNYCCVKNCSRTEFYRLAGDGKVRIVKFGRRSLVDVEYSDRHFDNLPEAKIKPDKRSKLRAASEPEVA
jgi:hypothetical protein